LSIDERATTRKEEGEGELEGWRGEVAVVARDRKFAPPLPGICSSATCL